MTITINKDGTLQLPEELLEALGSREVNAKLEGGAIRLEPVKRRKRIREHATPEERQQAFQEWASCVVQTTNATLPADWAAIRDGIYD